MNLKTKGTAYVVYESPDDAAEAMTHLNGFHLMERYIVGMCSRRWNIRCLSSLILPCSRLRLDPLRSFPFAPCLVPLPIARGYSNIAVLYHHPSKQQASALAKAEIRAREQTLADEKKRLGLRDD